MDRLISEKAVLDAIADHIRSKSNIAKLIVDIQAIPSAEPCDVFDEYGNYKYPSDVELTEPNTATSMPSGNAVSKQSVIDCFKKWQPYMATRLHEFEKELFELPSVNPQELKTGHWKDFALWVANEIFVYEWEYNKDAFAEIACRKLAKLGIVRAKGDEWELVEPQESEDKE